MSLLRGLLDRLSLVVLIVAAGATPSFVSQYQQQIGGRLEQDLEIIRMGSWEDDGDRTLEIHTSREIVINGQQP